MTNSQFIVDNKDALLIVDVQNDFLPGGSLPVTECHKIILPLNKIIEKFQRKRLPIFFTRDWHPENHISFQENNGIWPTHCVQNTWGAEFVSSLVTPKSAHIISKAIDSEKDAYSGFEGTNLHKQLQSLNIKNIFVGGLATDYCVLHTVKDGLELGYRVYLLEDGIKGVNVKPNDEQNAILEMQKKGAILIHTDDIL